ncbi:unnamed protein product [Pleuronectes platessa]|uniref:Uncharacterized protein n=1 Tax=Pleuronectes platessa TaxID=8262 RepID=A0A9N7YZB6_PLEPL|nr:unnamed protein product [Pleuronectes platessa]
MSRLAGAALGWSGREAERSECRGVESCPYFIVLVQGGALRPSRSQASGDVSSGGAAPRSAALQGPACACRLNDPALSQRGLRGYTRYHYTEPAQSGCGSVHGWLSYRGPNPELYFSLLTHTLMLGATQYNHSLVPVAIYLSSAKAQGRM